MFLWLAVDIFVSASPAVCLWNSWQGTGALSRHHQRECQREAAGSLLHCFNLNQAYQDACCVPRAPRQPLGIFTPTLKQLRLFFLSRPPPPSCAAEERLGGLFLRQAHLQEAFLGRLRSSCPFLSPPAKINVYKLFDLATRGPLLKGWNGFILINKGGDEESLHCSCMSVWV